MKHLSDNEFDKQFRDNLGDLSSTPSDLNWIGIEGNLDAAMPAKKDRRGWITLSAVLLLLLGSGITYVVADGGDTGNQARNVIANEGTTDKKARTLTQFSFALDIGKAEVPENTAQGNSDHASTSQGIVTTRTSVASEPHSDVSMHNQLASSHDSKSYSVEMMDRQSAGAINSESSESLQIRSLSDDGGGFLNSDHTIRTHKLTGVYVGMLGSIQKTTLSNPALDNWASRNNFAEDFTLGATYGLAMGYDFSSKFGIHAELQFNSTSSQALSFDDGSGPRQIADPDVLFKTSYTRIPVLFKYRTVHVNSLLNRPSAIQYLAGFSYGRLNWVNLPESIEDVHPDDFNMQEWGLIGGVEYVMHLHQHYSLALGIRGGIYGNLDQSPVLLAPSPTDAYASNIGITARLQFHLPKAEPK